MAESFRYRMVERHLMGLIESGGLPPGRRLPSLRELSARLGVGIATANHAYLEMERKGIIEARPRSGFFVRARAAALPTPTASSHAPTAPRSVNRACLIRAVLESVGNAALLPFGVVCPDERLLPARALGRILADLMRSKAQHMLNYEIVPGHAGLRRQIAWLASAQGREAGADEVIVTNGAMEALNLALRCVTRPGDAVLIQSPTYFCFLQLLETLGLRAIEIASSPNEGIDPADVREAVDAYEVRACILSPNFNNPDGSLTPPAVRAEVMDILARRRIPLIEDDVSGELYFGSSRPGSFRALDGKGLVLHCGSFSKTLAPGFRTGWLMPGRFMDKALELKATTSVCSATPTQAALAEYLGLGLFERHLRRLRASVRSSMETMRHHIAASFPPGTGVTRPEGGLVLWVQLPRGIDAVRLFHQARDAGIGIAPGAIFSTQEKFTNCIRLSCGVVWDLRLTEGMQALGAMARSAALTPAQRKLS